MSRARKTDAHGAFAQLCGDFIGTNLRTGFDGHMRRTHYMTHNSGDGCLNS